LTRGLRKQQGDCAKEPVPFRPELKKNDSFVKRDEMKLHPILLDG